MKLLDDALAAIKAVHEYFGYVEDWGVIPLDDGCDYYWHLERGEGYGGQLCYARTEKELSAKDGDYYESEIYTQRHLPKWVYRAADYTMVVIDTRTDLNRFLIVLDNAKERKP